jgi:hypothetical protein
LQGSFGRYGQFVSLHVFVSSKCKEFISTLSKVPSNEKTTSGRIEKHNIKIKHALNKRTRFNFISIMIKFKNILTVIIKRR